MVPTSTILACIATLLISIGFPILILLLYAKKNPKQGIVRAWLLGAAGFFVTQIVLRSPILSSLSAKSWFVSFTQEHLFLYTFLLAFTAGLFELGGRFAVARILEKKLVWKNSLAAGLGHGGIEAILITGMAYVNNLVYITMINSGTLFASVAPGAPEAITAQLQAIETALLTTQPGIFLLAGFERVLAMVSHAAMSVIVCWGVHTGRIQKAALFCLGLHTLIDLTAGISFLVGTSLTETAAYAIIYTILTLVAILSLFILRTIRRRWEAPAPEGE